MTTRFLARPTRGSLRARSRSSSGAAGVETPKSGRKRRKDPIPDPYLPPPPPSSFPDWEPRDFFRFELVHQSRKPGSRARVGRIHTPHGVIDTPSYVPVATQGALKFVDHRALEGMAPHLMFANTYHLVLNPGPDTVAAAGGLHKFMNRDQPLITDSGGFQIFSLALESGKGEAHPIELKGSVRKREGHEPTLLSVSEEGVVFKSYRDGTLLSLTPESTVDAQKAFGADIIIPLDELPPYHLDRDALIRSVMLTHRWEARSLRRHLADVRQQAMVKTRPRRLALSGAGHSDSNVIRGTCCCHFLVLLSPSPPLCVSMRADILLCGMDQTLFEMGDFVFVVVVVVLPCVARPCFFSQYGVVHGGVDLELRLGSAEYLTALPFDGYAIGGALGRDRSELIWLLEHLMPRLPDHKVGNLARPCRARASPQRPFHHESMEQRVLGKLTKFKKYPIAVSLVLGPTSNSKAT